MIPAKEVGTSFQYWMAFSASMRESGGGEEFVLVDISAMLSGCGMMVECDLVVQYLAPRQALDYSVRA